MLNPVQTQKLKLKYILNSPDKEDLKTHFVSESERVNTASCSELEASSSKVMTKSKPEN